MSKGLVASISATLACIRGHHWRHNKDLLSGYRVVTFRKGISTSSKATMIGLPVGEILNSITVTDPGNSNSRLRVNGFNGVLAQYQSSVVNKMCDTTDNGSVCSGMTDDSDKGPSGNKKSKNLLKSLYQRSKLLAIVEKSSEAVSHDPTVQSGQIMEPFLVQCTESISKNGIVDKNHLPNHDPWMDPDDLSDELIAARITGAQIREFWSMIAAIVSLSEDTDKCDHKPAFASSIVFGQPQNIMSAASPLTVPATTESSAASTITYSISPTLPTTINRRRLQTQLLQLIGNSIDHKHAEAVPHASPNSVISSVSHLGKVLSKNEFRVLRSSAIVPDIYQLIPPSLLPYFVAM
jgi:hypothetical protein